MQIPLFPLKTVLFPGGHLPLAIFEERYRTMTQELLDQGGVFGVLLIKHGNEVGGGAVPHDVGTTAIIEEAEEIEGGRIRLLARGSQRFKLLKALPPRPYPFGEIELIADLEEETTPRLSRALETVRTTFPSYFKMAFSLTDQWARPPELPANPHQLVDAAAQWLQTDEEVKQRLLEIVPAADRLAALAEVLDDLTGRTRADVTVYRRRKFSGFGAQN
jgi:Lon protease-like protein